MTTATPAAPSPFGDNLAGPAKGGTLSQFDGRLLLITPKEEITKKSKFPSKDGTGMVKGALVSVVVLDGPDAPHEVHRVQVLSGSMGPQLLPYIGTGKRVVGRLGQEEFDLGKGWVLSDPTEEEIALAQAYLAAHPELVTEGPKDPFKTI